MSNNKRRGQGDESESAASIRPTPAPMRREVTRVIRPGTTGEELSCGQAAQHRQYFALRCRTYPAFAGRMRNRAGDEP